MIVMSSSSGMTYPVCECVLCWDERDEGVDWWREGSGGGSREPGMERVFDFLSCFAGAVSAAQPLYVDHDPV